MPLNLDPEKQVNRQCVEWREMKEFAKPMKVPEYMTATLESAAVFVAVVFWAAVVPGLGAHLLLNVLVCIAVEIYVAVERCAVAHLPHLFVHLLLSVASPVIVVLDAAVLSPSSAYMAIYAEVCHPSDLPNSQ